MPKKFSFRLESVLKLRSYRVKQEKEALLQVQSLRIKKEKEIDENKNYLNTLYRNKKGKISVEIMQQDFYRQVFIKELIKKLEEERIKILEIEEQRRRILNEAMKEEKILLKLKEKKLAEYKFELDREDQKIMDEIAVNLKKDNINFDTEEVNQ